eukprot:8828041-Pyramimonas_sp.AAC.1
MGAHRSGTIIDVVASSAEFPVSVVVVPCGPPGVPGDHARLNVDLPATFAASSEMALGRSRWGHRDEWHAALGRAATALSFIGGWA